MGLLIKRPFLGWTVRISRVLFPDSSASFWCHLGFFFGVVLVSSARAGGGNQTEI